MNDTEKLPEHADVVCYLLLRTDIPSLGRGKAHAHAMHAGNHLTSELIVRPMMEKRAIDPRASAWHAQGEGFGTTLAVGGEGQVTLAVLESLLEAALLCGHLAGRVVDTSYPYQVDDEIMSLLDPASHALPPRRGRGTWTCFRRETTAAWVLGSKEEMTILLSQFGLVPND